MHLPDFKLYQPLTDLKRQMGIGPNEYGSFEVVISPGGLTVAELEKLQSVGIDVRWDELTPLVNGTFAYKDSRVLIYIRDIHQFGRYDWEPRFHLATCSVIQAQHARGRIQRYVVATKSDGDFQVNIVSQAGTRSEYKRLRVCQNCLDRLSFDGFKMQMPPAVRRKIVDEFVPARFFAQYPQSPHVRLPSHDSDGAPLNDYTKDFAEISRREKESAGWRCFKCGCVLSEMSLRRYLQVHHLDGNRWNNASTNLRVLCIECHADEPDHGHMRDLYDYKRYIALRRRLS